MQDYPAFFRISRMRHILLYSLAAALLIFGIWLYDGATDGNAYIVAWTLSIVSITLILALEIAIRCERITLTEHEIEHRIGILSKKIIRTNYHSISNVNLHQTILQRVFGFGDVYIDTPGGTGYEIILRGFSGAPKIEQMISAKTKHKQQNQQH